VTENLFGNGHVRIATKLEPSLGLGRGNMPSDVDFQILLPAVFGRGLWWLRPGWQKGPSTWQTYLVLKHKMAMQDLFMLIHVERRKNLLKNSEGRHC